MKYLEIRNWSRFQHYGDKRTPPWIKLHYETITTQDWVMWDDASKLLSVVCMMIASRHNGKVPLDPEYIKKVAHLSKKPDLKPLIESGFFEEAEVVHGHASTMLALGAITNEEEDKEEDTPLPPLGDFSAFWDLYPLRKAKPKAEQSYERALKKTSHASIMAGLVRYVASLEPGSKYIAHASTWLNQERWADEYDYKKPQTGFGKAGL